MKEIAGVYRALYDAYGPQGWWPVTKPGGTAPEYGEGNWRGLTPRQQFEVCVGAILAQNTAWKNAEKAVAALNKQGLMNPEAIASCPLSRLAEAIRSAGYYNQKAARLKRFASHIIRHYSGGVAEMGRKETGELRAELLALNGIGPETADSMLLYAFEKPVFVVDAYTKRIAARMGLIGSEKEGYDVVQDFFEGGSPKGMGLVDRVRHYSEFHALLVRHAKEHCAKRAPKCGGCPVQRACARNVLK